MHPTTRITTFFNLTPHTVCIILASGETLTIDPQPVSARVEQSHTFITPLSDDGDQSGRQVALAVPTYGAIIGLPAPVPTVAYIVSVFVANAAAALGRTDVVYPDSGPDAVRKDGQVVAVRRLLAPLAPPAPLDPYRTPGVQGSLTRLNLDKECLGMPEDHGTGEQPAGTRRDGTHLGIPAGRVWICRYGDTFWCMSWDFGQQCWVRDPIAADSTWPSGATIAMPDTADLSVAVPSGRERLGLGA